MKKTDVLGTILALVVIAAFLFAARYLMFESWSQTAAVVGGFYVFAMLVVLVLGAVVWVIYLIALARTNYYLRSLQRAGIKAYFDQNLVWEFAGQLLIGVGLTAVTAWASYVTWQKITVYGVYPDWMWYLTLGLLWVIGLGALASAVYTWTTSFRPIKRSIKRKKKGRPADLSRFDGT